MALAHSVAAADHAELNRRAAGAVNTIPDPLRHLAQVVMAGDTFAPRIGNADNGAPEILRGKAHGFIGRAVILVAQPFQNMFAAGHHLFLLNFKSMQNFPDPLNRETPAVSCFAFLPTL